MNCKEIDELPWLISRKEVTSVFGLHPKELRKLEIAGVIHRCKTSRKGKYFKSELIALARLNVG